MAVVFALVACGGTSNATPLAGGQTDTPSLAIQAMSAQQTADAAQAQATQAAVNLQNAQARIAQATEYAGATQAAQIWRATETAFFVQAAQTQAAITVTMQARETAVKLTADAQAILTRRALAEAVARENQIYQQAETDKRWASFWDNLSFIAVIVLGAGLVVAAFIGLQKLWEWGDEMVKRARNRTALDNWAVIGDQTYIAEGHKLKLLEMKNVTPPTDDQLTLAEIDRRKELWKRALMRLTSFVGDGEYTFPHLVNELKIVDPENWKLLTCYMVENHYLSSKGKGSKKVWADGWDKAKFHEAIKAGGLPPFPIDIKTPVPDVLTPA